MASLMFNGYMSKLRPCLYCDNSGALDWKKGLFHRWFETEEYEYDFIERKHVKKTVIRALVEDEEGYMLVPQYVRFIDSKGIIDTYDYTIPLDSDDSAKNT